MLLETLGFREMGECSADHYEFRKLHAVGWVTVRWALPKTAGTHQRVAP